MMQVTPNERGLKKTLRQQMMRDQDRVRAMFKDAAYRASLEAALQQQAAISDVEQRQEAEAELQRLSDAFARRVDGIGEAHAEAELYMQQQRAARAEQERRLAELNQIQEQRFHSALSAVKAQHGAARAQSEAAQQRRAQILRAERDKAQAFAVEQADRAQAQKRRQSDTARQEVGRRKRSPNGLAMDFRQTRLHEGVGPPPIAPPLTVPAVEAPPLLAVPDPVLSAEELQHRAAMEKRRREAAAAEAEIRARERFLAAQAKVRADAQRQAVEAELAELAAQRLQAKKQALAAHRLRLRDQRKQQELRRVFEDNFLSGVSGADDDLAPRALPAFLQPSAPATAAAAPSSAPGKPTTRAKAAGQTDVRSGAAGMHGVPAPPPQLPQPHPSEMVGVPRWSKGRTAPLGGRATSPPPMPGAWAPITAPPPPPPPPREEVAVQTDPELLAPAASQSQPPSAAPDSADAPHARPEGALSPAEPARRLAWSDPTVSDRSMPAVASTGTVARQPPALSPPSVTGGPPPAGDTRRPTARAAHTTARTQPPPTPLPMPLSDADLGELQLGDGDDDMDAWGEDEVDRELARMKVELGIEDSDMLRSSASSIDSGVSVPAFLKEAAARTAARQAAAEAADRTAAVPSATSPAPRPAPGPAPMPAGAPPRQGHPILPALPAKPQAAAAATGGGTGRQAAPEPVPVAADSRAGVPQRASGVDVAATAAAALDALGAAMPFAAGRTPPPHVPTSMPRGSSAPAAAVAASPADTLDSSILRLLDTPSSMDTPASSSATPLPPAGAGTATGRRPGGRGAGVTTARRRLPSDTPGSTTSLPSDLDDVLLLTELDMEELEGLAGLRSTGGGGGDASAGIAATASETTAGLSAGTNLTTAIPAAGGRTGGGVTTRTPGRTVGWVSGDSGGVESPSSTLSAISGFSDDSLRRLVAQGILPPEVATLLASTPPAIGTATPAPPSAAAPAAAAGAPRPGPSRPAATLPGGAQAAAAAAAASPTISTSSLSELASLLGPLGIDLSGSLRAAVSDTASLDSYPGASSLSSLSAYAAALGAASEAGRTTARVMAALGGVRDPSVAGPKPAARGLFTIPEAGARPPEQPGAGTGSAAPGPVGHRPVAPSAQGQPSQPSAQLPAPVRLTLADLNRQLLASVAGGRVAAPRGAASPSGVAVSPSGLPRPARPGPLIITPGGQELGPQLLHPPPALAPPRLQYPPPSPLQPPQPQQQRQGQPSSGASANLAGSLPPPVSLSLSDTSLSSVSSLSLSPTKPPHQRGGSVPQPASGRPGPGHGGGAGADPAALAATEGTDVTSGLREGHLGSSGPGAAASTPGRAVAAGAAGNPIVPASPYELYDKEAARLAELMATITASLRQSAEAVARAGSSSSSRVPMSPSFSTTTSSTGAATPGRDDRLWQAQQQAGPVRPIGAAAAVAPPPPSASPSSASVPSSSSWTVSLGSQSPVAAMLRNARAAAAAAAATAVALPPSQPRSDARAGQGPSQPGPSSAPPPATAPDGFQVTTTATTRTGALGEAHRPVAAAIAVGTSGAGASVETTQTTTGSATGSSSLSGLSSIYEMLRQGPPGPGSRSSSGGATGGMPLSRLGPPASPPPPPQATAGSPVPSLQSPPTPYSPILSESSYDTLSNSPDVAPASGSGGGAAAPPQPEPSLRPHRSPGQPGPGEPAPGPDGAGGPRASLALSLSSLTSSDGISSIAEMIAGILSQRGQPGGQGQPTGEQPPQPAPVQRQLMQGPAREEQTRASDPSGRPLSRGLHGERVVADDGSPAQRPAASAAAAREPAASSSDDTGRSRSSGRSGAEVWASLSGQTLAEALAGLAGSAGGPYEDLLRSSLALSISSLTSGASLEEDLDLQSLQGTLAASDLREMVLGDFTARESEEGASATGTSGAAGLPPSSSRGLSTSRTLDDEEVEAAAQQRRLEGEAEVVAGGSAGGAAAEASRPWEGEEEAGEVSGEASAGRDVTRQPAEATAEEQAASSGPGLASLTMRGQRQHREQEPQQEREQEPQQEREQEPQQEREQELQRAAAGVSTKELLAQADAALARVASRASLVPSSHDQAAEQHLGAEKEPEDAQPPPAAPAPAAASDAATTAAALPAAAQPPTSSLELRSSADSVEFESVMAGLMQDIQRGLAALQAPPLQVPPPSQQQQQQNEAGGQSAPHDPGRPEPGLEPRGAVTLTRGALDALERRTAADEHGLHGAAPPPATAVARLGVMPWDEDEKTHRPGLGRYAVSSNDSSGGGEEDGDDVVWWSTTASAGRGGGPGLEGGEGQPGGVRHPDDTVAAAEQAREDEDALPSPGRQVLRMPTFSRGFADAPTRSPRDSDAGSLRPESSAGAPAAAAGIATASRRRVSTASAASSGAASSVTLAPMVRGPPPPSARGVNAPASASAAGPASESGAYSFLQAPRAASAARTPPSVHSGAESASQAPSGGSSDSHSVSTVSSLDSLTNALAQYPVFGGGAESPLGSQSPASSDNGGAGAGAGAAGELFEHGVVAAEWRQEEPPLPIQYEPLQPLASAPVAPLNLSEQEQEPWRGAWDPQSPGRFTVAVSSATGAAAAALLGLRIAEPGAEAAAGSPPPELRSSRSSRPQPAADLAEASSEDLRSEQQQRQQYPQQLADDAQAAAAPERELRPGSGPRGTAAAFQEAQLARAADPQVPAEDAELPADELSQEEQQQQQQLSPSIRRQMLGLQPLTLEIPDDSRPGGGAAAAAARIAAAAAASPTAKAAGAGALVAAVASGAADSAGDGTTEAPPPQTPVRVRSALGHAVAQTGGARGVAEEPGARRSSGGGSAGSGYAGALSEELLADLLLWTVSDFFSSPGSGSGGEAE